MASSADRIGTSSQGRYDYEEAALFYSKLTVPELRRYQRIIQAQIPKAYMLRLTSTLEHLQRTDDLVANAIHMALWPKDASA